MFIGDKQRGYMSNLSLEDFYNFKGFKVYDSLINVDGLQVKLNPLVKRRVNDERELKLVNTVRVLSPKNLLEN